MTNIRLAFVGLALVALAPPMLAEAGQGLIAGGVVAATSIGSGQEVSVAGTIGYRVTRLVGFGVEVTSVPNLKPDVAGLGESTLIASNEAVFVTTSVPTSMVSGTDGRATTFTTNVRIEIPMSARIVPYAIGGGGIANVKESFTIVLVAAAPGIPVVIPPRTITQSSTNLALTLGGGVSLLVTAHLSIDVDLRYARLIAHRDLDVGRLGVGLSYRF